MLGNSTSDLDRAGALDRVGGDMQLLQEVAALFLEECPSLLSSIRSAIQANDPVALEHAAHSLKGSVCNFGAKSAYDAAFQLEATGKSKDLSPAPGQLLILERALERLAGSLVALCNEK